MRRQVECVAVPMEGFGPVLRQGSKGASVPSCGQFDRSPSDFLLASWVDPGAKRCRHELCAETNTERREISLQPEVDDAQFVEEERIAFAIIGSDRSAQDDEQIGVASCRRVDRLDRRVEIGDLKASPSKNRIEQTEILETKMAQDDSATEPHGHSSLS